MRSATEPPARLAAVARRAGALILATCALLGCASGGHAAANEGLPASESSPASTPEHEAEWGIEILGIRQSAAGYMLDFRYRVLDAEKARPLFERKTHPLLVHEATGTELPVMSSAKTGPLRNSNFPREGRGYFIFFVNPGKLVQPGDRVTVVIGDFEAPHLVVQ